MENQQLIQEDEVDLREYIKVIIKRKFFILTFFFIGVIAAAVSSINMQKTYKATATIMITPSAMQSVLSPTKGLLDLGNNGPTGENKALPWSISLDTHVNLLKSDLVLARTIGKLHLKDASGKDFTVEDLSRKLNIMKATGESVVQLEVTDEKPQEAQDIANAWAEQYVDYSQELILGAVSGIRDFVKAQFEVAKKDLFQAEEKVNDFKRGYKQDLMSAELKMKEATLNDYKKELDSIGVDLKTKEEALLELKEQIATQKKFIIVSKAITDDALWQVSSQENGLSGLDKKGLRSEIINPIYQDLETRIVNGEIEVNILKAREVYLKKSVESLIEETTQLDNDIIQKDFNLVQLTRQVDILKRSFDIFSNKIQEARIIKAIQLGEVKIVSPASTPNYPISQNEMKKVVLAGIFSLIFGMFLAFFMEFWQKGQ